MRSYIVSIISGFWIALFLCAGLNLPAQVMVTPTGRPASLIVCHDDGTFSLQIANTSGTTMTGATLTLDLPPGVWYTPGSATGATELSIANLNHPVFSLPDIPNNSAHTVTYDAALICGYTNSVNYLYIVTWNSNTYSASDPPLQNYYFPEPVITGITNSNAVIPVNTTVVRNITIQQQGINSTLDTLIILDEHTSDIQVLSVGLGTLHPYIGPGPLIVDTIIITGSDFPGGNLMFDAGEEIVIPETVKLLGCTNGQSAIRSAWGCRGETCNVNSAFPTVSPSSGTTVINIAFTSNRRAWGFIDNSGYVDMMVTNSGTGAGTAFNLTILSGFSSGGSTYYPNGDWVNEIDSFSVGGNYLPASYNYASGALNGQYAYYTTFQYTFDPDGTGMGLEDADGDGFFDDLPAGKSTTVRAHTYYDWPEAVSKYPTGHSCGQGWTNSAWQGFRFGYNYLTQCTVSPGVTWVANATVNQFMTYNTITTLHAIPPDIFDGTTVWMEHTVNTSSAVDNNGCPNDSVIYKITLPAGIVIGPGIATFKNVSMGTPFISGSTVIYYLDKSRILSGGVFRVPLTTQCETPHPSTASISVELKFWCDKTLFRDRFFTYWCSTSPIFGIQCPIYDCPDPSVSLFEIRRTTMGWTNNQLAARVSPSTPGLKLYNAMARDSIRILAAGKLNGGIDSLYFQLEHGNMTGNWSNKLFFDYLSDSLYYLEIETGVWHTCSGLNPQIINSSTSSLRTYFGNLFLPGGCLAGVIPSAGDSLIYVVHGIVKNITASEWRTVPALRGTFYWQNSGNMLSCNNRGATFNVLGSNYPFTAGTFYQQIVLQGCSTFVYEGLINRTLDVCGGNIAFPLEIRPMYVLDTMTFTLPEGFAYSSGTARHGYNNDNGNRINEVIPDPLIQVGPTGTVLTFIRTPSWSYSDFYDCWEDLDRITFSATPSCKATGDFYYGMNAKGRYQFCYNGSGFYQTASSSKQVDFTPPLVNLTSLITTAEGREDTVVWKIRLCNAKSFSANNNWIGFENGSAGIQITSVTDVSNPGLPVNLPVASYGPGKYWIQIGSIAGNACPVYEIRATYSVCTFDSLKVRHGYNCAALPLNPELGYPPSGFQCNENNTWLYLDPKEISLNNIVTTPPNPVSLCDTLDYEVQVTNSQLSNASNLQLTVELPPGITIAAGVSQFKYPYTTGSWVTISDPVNLPAGSNKWVYNLSADPNGILVMKGVDSIPKNGYQLKFKTITNCDFISGTSLRLISSATNACGDIHTRTSDTPPILIAGIPSNINLYVISTQMGPAFHTCSDPDEILIKVINLGPSSVSQIEKLGIIIDDAYNYVGGSLTGIHNGPTGIASNTVNGGIRYLNFSIEPNLTVNDSIVFTFELEDIDPATLQCDTLTMETNTLLVAQVPCQTAPGGTCLIHSKTAAIFTQRPVLKDYIAFGNISATSVPSGTTGELITLPYHLRNTGNDTLQTASVQVVFVHDANHNGIPDDTGADSLFSQIVATTGLPPGDSLGAVASFTVAADKVCDMLAAIRIHENGCICNTVVKPVSQILFDNAGPDIALCAFDTLQVGLPSTTGYSYIWVPSLYLSSYLVSNPLFSFNNIITQIDTLPYILTTTRPGNCISRDTMKVVVFPSSAAFAGNDDTLCSSELYFTAGAVGLNAQSLLWSTSGDGFFGNPALLNTSYAPGSGDITAGLVTLTLAVQGPCDADTDQVALTIREAPQISAGNDTTICKGFPIQLVLSGADNYDTLYWISTGDGTFNDSTLLHATYTPGPADTATGFTQLILTVSGHNPCPTLRDTMTLSFHPVPLLINSILNQTQCNDLPVNILLQSQVAGATFTWNSYNSQGNITGHSSNLPPDTLIRDTLFNNAWQTDTVLYRILPQANGCIGDSSSFLVAVHPTPDVTNDPLRKSICNGDNTLIPLTSHVAGTLFTWGCLQNSGLVAGWAANPVADDTIGQILTSAATNPDSVVYLITPHANGCSGAPTGFAVTVFPVTSVQVVPPDMVICSGQTTGLALQSPVTGTTFTWTSAGSSPEITGYSQDTGYFITDTLINQGKLTQTVTYTVTPEAYGCPPGNTASAVVTVHPLPVVTNPVRNFFQCNQQTTNINLLGNLVYPTTWYWTATGSSPSVTGYSDGSGPVIAQTLINTGHATELVTYTVTPEANNCAGDTALFTVTVYPVPDVWTDPPADTVCGQRNATGPGYPGGIPDPVSLNLHSHVAGTQFSWSATSPSPYISGYGPGSGDTIRQLLMHEGFTPGSVSYLVTTQANGCPGNQIISQVQVKPSPIVIVRPCFDTITVANAQPYRLRGSIPAGGTWSGTGVSNQFFHPSLADTGSNLLYYTYTNTFGCPSRSEINIFNSPFSIFNCGDSLFDPRDNQSYPTVQLGSQCWMASGLNYGTMISGSTYQRDNCIIEKYCFNNDPALCALGAALYQWDELMQYETVAGIQALCPAGWHVPTETEWTTLFNHYINNGFAGAPLKYTGYSGFNALLSGVRFNNISWNFADFATMLWSSNNYTAKKAWAHGMNEYNYSVSLYPALKSQAFGVRCIKD